MKNKIQEALKNKKVLTATIVGVLLLISIITTTSYAYFSASVSGESTATVITAGIMEIEFTDGPQVSLENAIPGDKVVKTFKVKNTGTVSVWYDVYLSEVINNFNDRSDLVYRLRSNDGGYTTSSDVEVPLNSSKIVDNQRLNVGQEHNYELEIEFLAKNENQDENKGVDFSAKISINKVEKASKEVTLHSNGGTLENNKITLAIGETIENLPEPQREGYNFEGWYTEDLLTNKVTNATVMTTRISDLYANWTKKNYSVTISGTNVTFSSDNVNVNYGESNTITITPATNYHISSATCTEGYSVSGITIGATTIQTATITNSNKDGDGTCTFNALPPLKVGDYIALTPTKTSYKIPSTITGMNSYSGSFATSLEIKNNGGQTINPSELDLWRVIDIKANGSMDVVSEYVSSTDVYFYGTTGYANFVGGLQTIAAQYAVSGYSIGTRHMGYDGQTLTISNTSAFDGSTNTAPSTTSTPEPTSGTGQEYGGGVLGDTLYIKDYQLVSNVYKSDTKTYGNNGLKGYKKGETSASDYWLASRNFYYLNAYFFRFNVVYVAGEGWLNDFHLRYFDNSWKTYSYSASVRPILTLKSGITTKSGSGTKTSPYTLN